MLKAACRRFHRRLERGIPDPHWRSCEPCSRALLSLELARRAGIHRDLPPLLRERLRRIVRHRPALAEPLPSPVLPAALALRLRRIPSRAGAPPSSLRSPVPAVAASTLLVVALGLLLGNPYLAGADAARQLAAPTERAWSALESRGATLLSTLTETSAQARAEARARTDELLGAGERLLERARELPTTFDPILERNHDESTAKGAPFTPPSSRRKESNE